MTDPVSPRVILLTKTDWRGERDGGSKRVAALLRALEEDGFEVAAFAVKEETTSATRKLRTGAALQVAGAVLRNLSLSTAKWYSPSIASVLYDEIHRTDQSITLVISHSQLAPYAVLAKGPSSIDLHNIESELLRNFASSRTRGWRRLIASVEARRVAAMEARFTQDFDLVAVVSQHDRDVLDRLSETRGGRVVIATNGVDSSLFNFEGPRDHARVVFTAHLGWRPNVDAAIWLAREVWPRVLAARPDARLTLAGRSPSREVLALVSDSIEIRPDVDDMTPIIGSARVATAPLLAAGGTRLKILEALAVGTPVVATPLGALGLESISNGLSIQEHAESFARELVNGLDADADRALLRGAVAKYRWEAATRDYIAGLRSLAVERAG
ncbi:glycosyltransferase family 4 protein [Microbacterium sp. NPDC006705]|uniref:glycosyltransferase family 4 protein n=1 Tax=Microbacterium sp. NPDC006705 TaxID=3364181 RepID=UPI00384B2499